MTLIVLGFVYLGLFFDAWVGHQYAGEGIEHPPQYFPVVFSPLASLAVLAAALLRSDRALRWTTRIVGALSIVMGLVGVVLHLIAIAEDLADEPAAFGTVMAAFGGGPPLLAPAAFAGVGVLVILLGAPAVRIVVEPRPAAGATPAG